MSYFQFLKFYKKAVILLSVLMINFGFLFAGNNKSSLEILFIGSSYFNFNNLPNLVNNLASHSGKEIYIDQYIPSGLYRSRDNSSVGFRRVSVSPVEQLHEYNTLSANYQNPALLLIAC